MKHDEIEKTDVVVVLDDLSDDQTLQIVDLLKNAGLSVESVDNENSVVEGCVDTSRLHELHKVMHVRYVRTVFAYEAQTALEGGADDDGEDNYED